MRKLLLYITILALLTSGCGFLSDDPVEVGLEPDITCSIDADQLSQVLTQNIDEQIRCLESNLLNFSNFVRRGNQNHILKEDLKKFIIKFFDDVPATLFDNLDLLFEMNMLFLRDSENSISRDKIQPFFKLLVVSNREGVALGKILREITTEENKPNYNKLREQLIPHLNNIGQTFVQVLSEQKGEARSKDLINFLENLKKRFPDLTLDVSLVEKWLFLKPIFLGGSERIITSDELIEIAHKMPTAVITILDTIYAERDTFSDTDSSRFLSNLVRNFETLLHKKHPKSKKIINADLLFERLQELFKNGSLNFKEVRPAIDNIKNRLVGGDSEEYTYGEVLRITHIAKDFMELSHFSDLAYDAYEPYLSLPMPLRGIPTTNPETFKYFDYGRMLSLKSRFRDVALNYRFHPNPITGVQNYDRTYRRSRKGMKQFLVVNWGLEHLVQAYGHMPRGSFTGMKELTTEELRTIMLELETGLKSFNLWPTNMDSFLGNTLIMSDLFQNQADGNRIISAVEATEYLSLLFNSREMATKLHKPMEENCRDVGTNPEEPEFMAPCLRKHFFTNLSSFRDMADSVPLLEDFVSKFSEKDIAEYTKSVDRFSRSTSCGSQEDGWRPCTDKDPLPEAHTSLLLGVMLNIESTFIRFDQNNDNLLEKKELRKAYQVFKETIIVLSGLTGIKKLFARPIFYFMIDKKRIPQTDEVLKYSLKPFRKIKASRLNLAALLKGLAEAQANPGTLQMNQDQLDEDELHNDYKE